MKLILILLLSVLSSHVQSQNLKDEKGLKTGLWLENNLNGFSESYYRDGKLNGFYREYLNENKMRLFYFGEYKNGEMSGKWYFIDNKSHLYMTCENIQRNIMEVGKTGGKKVVPKMKAFVQLFHKNGQLMAQGNAIFDDIEIDFYRVNNWILIDNTGKSLKTVKYSKPTIID